MSLPAGARSGYGYRESDWRPVQDNGYTYEHLLLLSFWFVVKTPYPVLRLRDFFTKYQDRVMFGTDKGMDEEMYRNNFRWLETADEYFDYWGYPAQGRWKIYGLDLPDPVLEKIYHLNAERMFSQFKGMAHKGAQ